MIFKRFFYDTFETTEPALVDIEVFVDDISFGVFSKERIEGLNQEILLQNLTGGAHTIRIAWSETLEFDSPQAPTYDPIPRIVGIGQNEVISGTVFFGPDREAIEAEYGQKVRKVFYTMGSYKNKQYAYPHQGPEFYFEGMNGWDTTQKADGDYHIQAKVYLKDNSTYFYSHIYFTIANENPPPPPGGVEAPGIRFENLDFTHIVPILPIDKPDPEPIPDPVYEEINLGISAQDTSDRDSGWVDLGDNAVGTKGLRYKHHL